MFSLKNEVNIFNPPYIDATYENGSYTEFLPVTSLSSTGKSAIEFHIPGSDEYLDLSQSYLHVRAKLVKPNGDSDISPIVVNETGQLAGDPVTPINYILNSMFTQVDVMLQDKLITVSNGMHGYKSFAEVLLNYGREAKNTWLKAGGYVEDDFNHADSLSPKDNPAAAERQSRGTDGKIISLTGMIHSEMFQQTRALLSKVDVRLRFTRAPDAFVLMAANDVKYRLEIVSAALNVRTLKLAPALQLAHEKMLLNGPALYPIREVRCKALSLPAGLRSVQKDNIFTGTLPRRIVIALVSDEAFTGSYKTNPFNFKRYDLQEITFSYGGHQIPHKGIQINQDEFSEAYLTLCAGSGKLFKNEGAGIPFTAYPNFFCMAIDFTSDLSCMENHEFEKRTGSLRAELKFSQALPHTVDLICIADFDAIIQIDRQRNIITDYN